jgi:RNase P subunit RPR2
LKSKPVDPAARYVCPACKSPELQPLSFLDDYEGSAANTTTRCLRCGLLRRYRESTLRKAAR